MSYFLVHLASGWHVDQAILSEEDRVVVIRFGHDHDPVCTQMDETLYRISEKVRNFAVIYLVDTTLVPDFNRMYELYDPCAVMFFYVSPSPAQSHSSLEIKLTDTHPLLSATNTSWSISAQETTTKSTGPLPTSKR